MEETEEFGRKVTGLSGRARWQVRKLLAVLTRSERTYPPAPESRRSGDWVGAWDLELRPAELLRRDPALNLRECRKVAIR